MNLLRQYLGLFFVVFGITKIVPVLEFGYGFAGTVGYVASMGFPFAAFLVAAAIAVEIVLGLILMAPKFGNGTVQSLSAYGLAAFTVLATVMFHISVANGPQFTVEITNVLKNICIVIALLAVAKKPE